MCGSLLVYLNVFVVVVGDDDDGDDDDDDDDDDDGRIFYKDPEFKCTKMSLNAYVFVDLYWFI